MKMTRRGHQKFMERTQTVLEELWPETVIYDGNPYAAACPGRRGLQALQDGGLEESGDLTVRISKDILPVRPEEGKRLIYKDKDFQVSQVLGDQEPAWTLRCEAE